MSFAKVQGPQADIPRLDEVRQSGVLTVACVEGQPLKLLTDGTLVALDADSVTHGPVVICDEAGDIGDSVQYWINGRIQARVAASLSVEDFLAVQAATGNLVAAGVGDKVVGIMAEDGPASAGLAEIMFNGEHGYGQTP